MLGSSLPRTLLSLLLCSPLLSWQASLGERDFVQLSSGQITTLISSPDPVKNLDPSNPSSHLSKILIPRVSDTENNVLVRNYIISTLKALDWHIEEDAFNDTTPLGTKQFTNIIATKDPEASRRVVVAAHFDSKYFPNTNEFVGATDSAAPCAMMLDLAEALNPLLEARSQRLEDGLEDDEDVADTTLQLLFFDGEEAFVQWTDTDSIYGARHLAEKWATTYVLPNTKRRLMPQTTELDAIEHLILLDLLGAPQPSIKSYFKDTAWLYNKLVDTERKLGNSDAFVYNQDNGMAADSWKSYFRPVAPNSANIGYMGDDHVPFLKRGVSVLHLIAEPFPHVWHTVKDDASALDIPTMRRWNILLRVFMSEYLNLQPQAVGTRSQVEREVSELT
ncbi:hypothetical protein K435DRAFT_761703 [Dendrothele bispora CBS 962.96]|uniref:Peptide hydrolase n=1 Tax=Dendrothele bispora (strain CBS 962.96) TaxID=1314807 RepID=A0A4S8LHM2_DENBC|nr:hypothetical protein K435DRAFT_761703 [Dendrothele bispora CBS 962.96]